MNVALFIMGGLAVLLLFGCVGPAKGPKEIVSGPEDDYTDATSQPAGDLGDAEISTSEPDDLDDVLPEEDLLIPPPEEESESSITIDVSDVFVEEGSDMDIISEEEIIEPI
ncbi:MAG: hypothetical protein ABH983_05700 [Candidatus Micrarchaeota archaeon]|nr:hypothetical protein [Candidatus Micrarchaeota archaeon]MBU1681697.1 hypothetical protein [Candidatus Micrarchaeota archaeon]